MVDIFHQQQKDILPFKIESYAGHDAFLIEHEKINPIIDSFLNE